MADLVGNPLLTNVGDSALLASTFVVAEVALGSGSWSPDKTSTSLQNEVTRVAATGVVDTLASGDPRLRITAVDDSALSYDLREFALLDGSGNVLIIHSQASIIGSKGSGTAFTFAMDLLIDDPAALNITISGTDTWQLPQASEVLAGVIEIATDAEADAGTDDTRAVTARHVQRWVQGGIKSAAFRSDNPSDVAAVDLASPGGRVLASRIRDPLQSELWRCYRLGVGSALTWVYNAWFDPIAARWTKDDPASVAYRYVFSATGGFYVERDPGTDSFTGDLWERGAGIAPGSASPLANSDGEPGVVYSRTTIAFEAKIRTGSSPELVHGHNAGTISYPTSQWCDVALIRPLADPDKAIATATCQDSSINVAALMTNSSTARLRAHNVVTGTLVSLSSQTFTFSVRVSGQVA